MSRKKRLIRLLLVCAAIASIPGAIAIVLFAQGLADSQALRVAPICEIPNRDGQAGCVSVLNGTIKDLVHGGSKYLPSMTVAVADTTVTVAYERSPVVFEIGNELVTGWWKGQMVLIGPPGGSPTIVTDLNPTYRLEILSYALGLVIPPISLLLAGLLVLQAPMNVDELISTTLARWPDPPRPVDRKVVWGVAGGYFTYPAYIIWTGLYLIPVQLLLLGRATSDAPGFLVGTFVVTFTPYSSFLRVTFQISFGPQNGGRSWSQSSSGASARAARKPGSGTPRTTVG